MCDRGRQDSGETGKAGNVIHNTCTCKLFGQTEEKGTSENAWLIKGPNFKNINLGELFRLSLYSKELKVKISIKL